MSIATTNELEEVYHDVLGSMFGSQAVAGKSTQSSKEEAYQLSKGICDDKA